MIHTKRLLTWPSPDGLSDLMKTQHRLLEEMLFRTIELHALVDAGQHRFIGRALDDLERTERELGRTELVRAAITEALVGSVPGVEPSLSEVLAVVDEETAALITRTGAQIRDTFEEIERVRREATPLAAERVNRTRNAVAATSSAGGLYGRH